MYQNWAEFSREFRNKFPNKHIHSVFKRLQRTGLINEVMETEVVEEDGSSLDIGYAGFEADQEFSKFNEMVLKTFSGN